MSQPCKKASKSVDGPLTDHEVSATVGLLHRAIAYGQTPKVMMCFRKSLVSKAEHVPAAAFMEELQGIYDEPDPKGGMSDATKRRLTSEDSSPRYTEWDQVSMCGSEFPDAATRLANMPMPSGTSAMGYMDSSNFGYSHVNSKIKTPDGMSIQKWGSMICKMDKVKDRNLSYEEMLYASAKDPDLQRYLSWIENSYGTDGSGVVKKKYTAAVDLALFLEAVDWKNHPLNAVGATMSQAPLQRTFKK